METGAIKELGEETEINSFSNEKKSVDASAALMNLELSIKMILQTEPTTTIHTENLKQFMFPKGWSVRAPSFTALSNHIQIKMYII